MRKCLRCGNEMVEGCGIKVFASNAGITLTDDEDKAFFGRLGSPKVAICPVCGEVSLYMPDGEKLKKLAGRDKK